MLLRRGVLCEEGCVMWRRGVCCVRREGVWVMVGDLDERKDPL